MYILYSFRKTAALLLLMLPFALVAQEPAGYYSGANGKRGAALKTALYNTIKGHTVRTYADLWTDFVQTDSRPDGKVWDMYSSCVFTWGKEGNQDQGTGGNAECQFYNREHSFPQSWFGSDKNLPMYTDIFHLIPSDKFVNGKRGNMPYGEVGAASQTFGNSTKIGTCSFAGCTGTVFEPIDEYKGDFARNYFYMVTRYENLVASWYSNADAKPVLDGTAYPAFSTWTKNMLLKWHRQDTVSKKERDRNNAVYQIQRNRNPFIDHPELAEYIWGDSTAYAWNNGGAANPDNPEQTAVPQLRAGVDFSLYPNPASMVVNVALPDGVQLQRVEVFDLQGTLRLVQEGSTTEVNVSSLYSSNYIFRVHTAKGSGAQLLQVVK